MFFHLSQFFPDPFPFPTYPTLCSFSLKNTHIQKNPQKPRARNTPQKWKSKDADKRPTKQKTKFTTKQNETKSSQKHHRVHFMLAD